MALAHIEEPDPFVVAVARNIRSLLAIRGLQAKELAERVGLSDTTLSQRMGGHNRWLAVELHRIAKAFDVNTDVIFAETEADFLEAMSRSRCSSEFDLQAGLPEIGARGQIPGQYRLALAI